MASFSENLRKSITTSPGYSGSSSSTDGASAVRRGIRTANAAISSVYEEDSSPSPFSTENRAGWLASIGEVFGISKDKEEDQPKAEDPEETVETRDVTDTSETTETPEVRVEEPTPSSKRGVMSKPTGNAAAISAEEIEDIIRVEAKLRRMDPDVAVRIWKSEGGSRYQSEIERDPKKGGSLGGYEASFGPFQLFTGGGLGNDYERLTGRKLVDDNTLDGISRQIQFALDMAVRDSWKHWYGRKTAGVGLREGLENAVQLNNWKDS